MLNFNAYLEEKKSKIKINPKKEDMMEKCGTCAKTGEAECKCGDKTPAQRSVAGKGRTCPKCNGEGCKHCDGKGYHDGDSEGADMSEAKKKDDSYLEVDPKKRQKNNEKARKEMDKVPSQKNPHFESTGDQAYGSQEEVSEESTEEVAETENTLLTFAELYKGKHGQSEKEYQDSRSQGGKMVSGDSKGSGAKYSHGRRVDDGGAGPQPAGGSKKPKAQGKMDRGGRAELQMRKANLKAKKNEALDHLKDNLIEGAFELYERTRYAKETGKDPQTGKPSEKGGTIKPGSAMSKVRKSLAGQGLMSSRRKAIQPQGKKKEKGAKGYQGQTPVDKIKGNLARKKAPKPEIGSRFD
jgi:hypothetical protein